jgi:hypothetical protein
MQRDDLSRQFFLDVCANGSVAIRERGQSADGRLPVFTTATHDEASQLRTLHCRLARDGSGIYFLNEPIDGVGDLANVADLFCASYARIQSDAHP